MSSMHQTNAETAWTESWQVRNRALALCRSAAAEFEAVTRLILQAQQTCAELRALLHGPTGTPDAPADTAARILADAGLSEADLADLADDLITAYHAADVRGDAERRAAVGRALRVIGRHLAAQLGPRAAGVVLH